MKYFASVLGNSTGRNQGNEISWSYVNTFVILRNFNLYSIRSRFSLSTIMNDDETK